MDFAKDGRVVERPDMRTCRIGIFREDTFEKKSAAHPFTRITASMARLPRSAHEEGGRNNYPLSPKRRGR